MSIYKRGKSWYYDFISKGQRYTGSFGAVSRTVAKEEEHRLKSQALEGQLNPHKLRQTPTFTKFVDEQYLPWLETNRKPATLERSRMILHHAAACFGAKRLDAIAPLDIERFKKQRKDAGRQPGSINLELTILRTVFNRAIAWQFLRENPAKTVQKLPRPEGKTRFLTDEEQHAVLAVASPELTRAVRLGALTGLRRRELTQLRPEDINLERKTLTVAGEFAKTGKSRTLPVSPQLRALLEECLAARRNAPTVLVDHNGTTWSPFCFADAFRRACKAALHESLGPHVLRHTFCSRLVMAGVDIRTVQELAGHASIVMTMRYAHLTPDHKQQAMEKLEQAFPSTSPATSPATAFSGSPTEHANVA
jgi:integrase